MKATPQDGDADGKTSQFVGKLPEAAVGGAVDVTIPNLRIGSERFRVGFTTAVQQHDSGMPAAVTGTEEQMLYFTPGGKYTQADIDANGKLSAGQKFRGFMSKHDMRPKPGDLICPVTFTKANPKVEWLVGGKTYLFCCPPCVDEFVRMAKEEPEDVLEPEDYVQKEKGSGGVGSGGDTEKGSQKKDDTASTNASSLPDSPTPDSQLEIPDSQLEIAEALAELNADDRKIADAQKFCAVMTDSLLGSMGTPIKIDIKGRPVFLCCKGCKTKAMNDPEATLAAVAELKASNNR
jgi:YHS domain-containing protein